MHTCVVIRVSRNRKNTGKLKPTGKQEKPGILRFFF
jgi:hypothetical protein